jgi:hypothetical protein
MEDSITSRYTHLFRELWAAALHSPPLNAALEHFYDQTIEDVVTVVAPSIDARSRTELKTIVYFMCVLSEGSSVVFGSRASPGSLFAELKDAATRTVITLAESLKARD